jgi:hypothetical protein
VSEVSECVCVCACMCLCIIVWTLHFLLLLIRSSMPCSFRSFETAVAAATHRGRGHLHNYAADSLQTAVAAATHRGRGHLHNYAADSLQTGRP